MCSDPLEISYSHIAEITLQDAPNVISQGFSNRICSDGETPTSNIMDFFPSLTTSLRLSLSFLEFILVDMPPRLIFTVVDISFVWMDVINLDSFNDESTQKRNYAEHIRHFTSRRPLRRAWLYGVVTHHFISISILSLPALLTKKTK